MLEHEEEGVEGDAVSLRGEVDDALLLLFEVVREERLKVLRARCEYHLVAVDGRAVKYQSDV